MDSKIQLSVLAGLAKDSLLVRDLLKGKELNISLCLID
jgi:hypothetical protein